MIRPHLAVLSKAIAAQLHVVKVYGYPRHAGIELSGLGVRAPFRTRATQKSWDETSSLFVAKIGSTVSSVRAGRLSTTIHAGKKPYIYAATYARPYHRRTGAKRRLPDLLAQLGWFGRYDANDPATMKYMRNDP